jgi:hypothetical protein
MGMQLSGSLNLTGSLNVSGSTVQIGNNTLTGNTVLSGSVGISGSTIQAGNNTIVGNNTITGTNRMDGNTTLSGSIIISGSDNTATPTIRIFGDMQTDGVIKFDPVSKTINNSISASYIFVSGSTQDLHFSQNGAGYSNITRLRWLEGNLYTGILGGGVISQIDSTNYKISKGSGMIVNLNASTGSIEPYPTIQYLQWNDLSSSINSLSASYDQQFIGIDSNGQIVKQGTPFADGQFNTLINVGLILHQNHSTINAVKTQPNLSYGLAQRVGVFTRAFGPLKVDGFILSGSGTQGLQVSSGIGYLEGAAYSYDANNPNYVIDSGTTTSKIWRYYNTSSYTDNIYDTNNGAGYAVVDPTQYSNNGTLTTVTGTNSNNYRWTIQRVFWYPNSVGKAFVVYYGNDQYTTQALAFEGLQEERFVEAPNTKANGIYLGALLLRKDFTWADSTTYKLVPAGLFRSVSSGGGASGISGQSGTSGTSGVSGTSGLNGTFFGTSGTSGQGTGIANYYGNFFSTGSQNVAGANIATTASLESTGDASGISMVSNRRITVANTGVYEITFSAQVEKTQGTSAALSIWFQKNGVKIDNSASYTSLVSNSVYTIVTVPIILSLTAGDYLEVVFASDSQYVRIVDVAANAVDSSPQAPSFIVTMKQVGVAVGSTSGTSGVSGTSGINGTSGTTTVLTSYTGSVSISGSLTVSTAAISDATYLANSSNLILASGSNLYIYNDGLASVSGSLKVTGSIITTLGITGPINATNGVISSSAQLTALNTYTGSNDSVISRILQTTASINTTTGSFSSIVNQVLQTTASLNAYTASESSIVNRVLQTTSSLNTYTGSNDSVLQRILQTTASLNLTTGSLIGITNGLMAVTASMKAAAIVSSSTQVSNYFVFAQTSSANTFYNDQTITGSLNVSSNLSVGTAIINASAMLLTGSSIMTLSTNSQFILTGSQFITGSSTISGSVNITGSLRLNGVSVDIPSLNTYTGSNDNLVARVLQTTASLNTYTGSNDSVVNKVLQTTASLNTYTGSNDSVINRILQTTSSLNSKTGSYITTGSAGLTQSITGSLAITGSMTISSGSITMPNRPGVRVTGAGGSKAATTALSGSYLIVDWQQSNAWDNSTGTFTAPIAGLYQVNLVVRTNSNSLGTISQLIVFKNNTSGANGTAQIMVEFGTNTTMNHTGGSTISKLAVGDTLRMIVAAGEISFDSNDNFSVAYIG